MSEGKYESSIALDIFNKTVQENITGLNITVSENVTGLNINVDETVKDDPDEIFSALSYACTALSIVCLCVHIAVYFLLPSLQNVPAKMVIYISIGWIIAEVLEIIDENIETTNQSCYVIGVIQQYVYLSIFAWTNIMAYDVQRAFRSQVQSTVSKCRFACYSLYGWCLPLLIAAASLTLYIELPETGNSSNTVCYYGSPMYALINCLIVFSMLLANMVMFAIAVCFLCKTARETKMAANSKNKEYFVLCIKLAVVLGLPWIPLLFFSLTESRTMSGVAEIFVGLHGLYVFLIFTCKKKTWRLLKRRFGSKKTDQNTTESVSLKHVDQSENEKRFE